jgi:hypothetical protein
MKRILYAMLISAALAGCASGPGGFGATGGDASTPVSAGSSGEHGQ